MDITTPPLLIPRLAGIGRGLTQVNGWYADTCAGKTRVFDPPFPGCSLVVNGVREGKNCWLFLFLGSAGAHPNMSWWQSISPTESLPPSDKRPQTPGGGGGGGGLTLVFRLSYFIQVGGRLCPDLFTASFDKVHFNLAGRAEIKQKRIWEHPSPDIYPTRGHAHTVPSVITGHAQRSSNNHWHLFCSTTLSVFLQVKTLPSAMYANVIPFSFSSWSERYAGAVPSVGARTDNRHVTQPMLCVLVRTSGFSQNPEHTTSATAIC